MIPKLRILLPVLALGAVAAAPLIAPEPDARRLEVLFFGAPTANHPGHDPITRYRALKKGLGTAGINLTYAESPSEVLRPDTLDDYDAVLMYANWEQNGPMPPEQLDALVDYVEGGGGFIPVHCASACYGGSEEFIDLIGARFASHGAGVFQVRDVKPNHPILNGLEGYEAWDETYVHDRHGDDREILQMREDEPWTWTRTQGEGRVFYTAGGHDHRVWDLEAYQNLLRNGIYWAVGPEKYQQLQELDLPELEQEEVSLPGYREREEITRAQKPISPAESMKLAKVPSGMELALFASEPDIVNPIHIAWDHRGRAYVTETIDYPNNLQDDNLGHDRITICEDTDGDGRADEFTRFAENLSIPTSLTFVNGGVVCTNGTQMLFLKDTDGDDRADVREVLFEGFNMGDTHAGVSNLRYGFDGWIYATIGYSGFDGTVGGETHRFGTGVFRFHVGEVGLKPVEPENGTLERFCRLEFLQNTTNNTWGLGFTEEFDVIGSTANANPSWYVSFPEAVYDSVGLDQPRTPAADDNPIFNPMSTDIRQVDQFDRYTSAAGHAVYTAERFPESYRNRAAFVCGPTGKLVGHFDLNRDGAGWRAVQSPNNLYASADAWSAPVCAEVGPDGAVWLCDWYNIVVQHNPTPSEASAGLDAENGKGNAYRTPHRDKQHGRIYRVYPKGSENDTNPGLDPSKPETLVAGLDHPNLFWRLHAQRLIHEQGSPELAPELVRLVRSSEHAAPHALQLLADFQRLPVGMVESALDSSQPALRSAALRLASPADLKNVFLKDGTLETRTPRELADALIGLSSGAADPAIGAAIYEVAKSDPAILEDSVLGDAWSIAARRQADAVLAAASDGGDGGDGESPSGENENLLPNPGFTETSDGKPADWTDLRVYANTDPSDVTLEASSEGREDDSSLMISSDQRADSGAAVTVPIQPRTRYRLSGWIKTRDLDPSNDNSGAMMNIHSGARTEGVTGTSDWTRVSLEFDSGDRREAVIHCLFGGYGGSTGTAWWDDVSLMKIGGSADLPGQIEALRAYRDAGDEPEETVVDREFEPDPEIHDRGQQIYNQTCIACHGADGSGVPNAFPPLDGSDWVTDEPSLSIRILLHGLSGPVEVNGESYNSVMPPHVNLSDRDIADVLTYVRQTWSNDAAPVEPSSVKSLRDRHTDRKLPWTAEELGR